VAGAAQLAKEKAAGLPAAALPLPIGAPALSVVLARDESRSAAAEQGTAAIASGPRKLAVTLFRIEKVIASPNPIDVRCELRPIGRNVAILD